MFRLASSWLLRHMLISLSGFTLTFRYMLTWQRQFRSIPRPPPPLFPLFMAALLHLGLSERPLQHSRPFGSSMALKMWGTIAFLLVAARWKVLRPVGVTLVFPAECGFPVNSAAVMAVLTAMVVTTSFMFTWLFLSW